MTRRVLALSLLVALTTVGSSRQAGAQWIVHDPTNWAELYAIAQNTWEQVSTLYQTYDRIRRLSQRLGNLDAYRVSGIPTVPLETSPYPYGSPWLVGLNSGDPTGAGYRQVVRPLVPPAPLLARLSPRQQDTMRRAYATIELADSVATMGGHQVGALRQYADVLREVIEALQSDTLNPLDRFHEMTAILDKIAAGEVTARRQDTATNQLLSHVLEQRIVEQKRERDTEAAMMNMRLERLLDDGAYNRTLYSGTSDALNNWRQP